MKLNSPFIWAVLLLSSPAAADFQFRSRPDLSPPRLNITAQPSNASALTPGYIFIAQYPGFGPGFFGPEQPGAYIFRPDGELIWSGQGFFGGWVADFGPTSWRGRPALRAFQGRLVQEQGRGIGNNVILNDRYEVVKTVRAGSHGLLSVHEFQIVEGGTEGRALIEVPLVQPVGLQRWGGSNKQNWIINNGFQEVDIATGKVVFEWHSLDHVDPKHSALSLKSGLVGSGTSSTDPWNYFHINSIDKDRDGNYLISARNYATLFKINGTSGSIIWALGGLRGLPSDFSRKGGFRFGFQHDARFLSRTLRKDGAIASETVSFFDNAAHSANVTVYRGSRARIVRLDYETKTAHEVETFVAPDGLSAASQGNAQVLPSGHVFVNWGQAGAVTEFAPDGEVLYHAYLDSEPGGRGVQSYRGFKGEWSGRPSEEAAIVALEEGDSVAVYVSWNGDTETASWRFFVRGGAGAADGTVTLAGQKRRSGFETRFALFSKRIQRGAHIAAEAVDRHGQALGRTRFVAVIKEVVVPHGMIQEGGDQEVIGNL